MAHIGIPTMKLKNAKTNTKRAGTFLSVAGEALGERWGKDPDIDRERTPQNIYTGYDRAHDLYDYSNQHVAELEEKLGHKIRNDSVRMVAVIFKPSKEYMEKLPDDKQIDLLNDTLDIFKGIVGEENVKSTVIHVDEQVKHMHCFFEPMTPDGRLCAKEALNLKVYNRINTEIPQKLRAKGWDIEDCKMYDEKMSEEDKIKHHEAKMNRGLNSTDYKSKAEAETLKKLEAEITVKKEELVKVTEAPSFEKYTDVVEENILLKADLTAKEKIINKLQEEVEKLKESVSDLKERFSTIAHKAGAKLMKIFGIKPTEDIPEMPSREVAAEIKLMTEGIKGIDPTQLRVLPDQEAGKFRVAVRTGVGTYETVQGGFVTKELAEKYRRNFSGVVEGLGESVKDSIKNGIS